MDLNMHSFRTYRSWVNKSVLFLVLGFTLPFFLGADVRASDAENPLFGYPHQLASPFTIRSGQLLLGTDASLGVTDFLQAGTSLIYDFYKVYNVNTKVSFFDREDFAFAATFEWITYNYQDISPGNPDIQVRSWLPGITTAYALHEDLALFVGGNLNYTSTDSRTSGIETSGYTHGTRVGADLAWAYNPRKKRMSNVLAGGLSYDLTYQIYGFGVSHYWPGFRLGIHYYPNATLYRVQPIIAGGMALNF